MRGGIVAIGIIFIGLSIGWYLLIPFSPGLALLVCIMSPVLFIVGILLFIVGLVAQHPQPMIIQYQAPMQPQTKACPTCGYPLTWIPQRNKNYCYRCRRYIK